MPSGRRGNLQVVLLRLAFVGTQSLALAEQPRPTEFTLQAFLTVDDELLGELGIAVTVHDGSFLMLGVGLGGVMDGWCCAAFGPHAGRRESGTVSIRPAKAQIRAEIRAGNSRDSVRAQPGITEDRSGPIQRRRVSREVSAGPFADRAGAPTDGCEAVVQHGGTSFAIRASAEAMPPCHGWRSARK